MLNSIRTRLTLWYLGVLAVVIIAFAFSIYFLIEKQLHETTDKSLTEISQTIEADLHKEEADLVLERQQLAAEQAKDKEKDEDDEEKPSQDEKAEENPTIEGVIAEELEDLRFRDSAVVIFDQNSRLAGTTDFDRTLEGRLTSLPDQIAFADIAGESEQFRAHQKVLVLEGKPFRLFVVRSNKEQTEFLNSLRWIFLFVTPLVLVLAGLAGYLLARSKLAPLVSMSEQATRIGSSNLNERLAVKNERDELGSLAKVFNNMLGRLEDSFDQQKQFMADASHELRTPLAIVRGESQVAISKDDRTAGEYRESLAIVHDESLRLTKIVEDLFTLARADSGQLKAQLAPVFLDEILVECVHAIGSIAKKRNVKIDLATPRDLKLDGDETLLHRMFLNLLDNAIKYNREGGDISVTAEVEDNAHVVSIKDTGQGIAPEDREKIFKRFYRTDKSRTRDNTDGKNGVGLGLSIATWIADAHNGSLVLKESGPEGSAFEVRLPRSK